jgi:hypothetical protein
MYYKPFTEDEFKQMYKTYISDTDIDDISFGTPEWSYERYLQEQFIKRLTSSESERQIKHKAIESALQSVFCDIENDEQLQDIVDFYYSGFTAGNGLVDYTVREPFQSYGAKLLVAVVDGMVINIINTFTVKEPNDNNGGYMGTISVSNS